MLFLFILSGETVSKLELLRFSNLIYTLQFFRHWGSFRKKVHFLSILSFFHLIMMILPVSTIVANWGDFNNNKKSKLTLISFISIINVVLLRSLSYKNSFCRTSLKSHKTCDSNPSCPVSIDLMPSNKFN